MHNAFEFLIMYKCREALFCRLPIGRLKMKLSRQGLDISGSLHRHIDHSTGFSSRCHRPYNCLFQCHNYDSFLRGILFKRRFNIKFRWSLFNIGAFQIVFFKMPLMEDSLSRLNRSKLWKKTLVYGFYICSN